MLEQLVGLLSGHSLHAGWAFVFVVLVLCGFGFPMPEDVILVTGGVCAWLASGLEETSLVTMVRSPELLSMVGVGLAGILVGDTVIFLAGRRLGSRVAEIPALRRVVTPEKLERVERLFRKRGDVVVLVARFLPGLRAPTYFTAGHSRMPLWEFLLFDGFAAVVSAPLWVGLGFYFGSDIERAAQVAAQFGHYLLAGALVIVVALIARWAQVRRAQAQAARADLGGDGADF